VTSISIVAAAVITIYASTTFQNTHVSEHFTPALTSTYNSTVPVEANRGTLYNFNVQLTNPSTVASPTNLIVHFVITKDSATAATDAKLEYNAGNTQTPNWQTIPLVSVGNTLTGNFGPEDGFPVTANYDQTTQMRVTFNVNGNFNGVATLQTLT
jgi:hypothetical protein